MLEEAKKHIINIVKAMDALENYFIIKDGGRVSCTAPDWGIGFFNKEHCYDYGQCQYFNICRTNLDERALKMYRKVRWDPKEGKEVEIKE
jgi:hypothetical protein